MIKDANVLLQIKHHDTCNKCHKIVIYDTGSGGVKSISTYNAPGGFQMSLDFQSFIGKKRNNFTKEGIGAKFDLGAANKFSRGDTIKGNIMLLDEKAITTNIRHINYSTCIENAVAQGPQRITTVEKYENKIRIGANDNSKDVIVNSDNNYTVPFEIQIPYSANTSYVGKYSEYYWRLEAKIDLPWSSDIYARSMVEVIY